MTVIYEQRAPEDVALILDRSMSMNSDDYPPTRLGAAKAATIAHVEERRRTCPGDLVAIVSFATTAEVVLPLTPVGAGYAAIRHAIEGLTTGAFTAMGEGLACGKEALLPRVPILQRGLLAVWTPRGKRLLLLTDGHTNQERDPLPIAQELKARSVIIDVIGIGGSPSDVDEPLLRKIASVVDGQVCYRFIRDREELVTHFRKLATGITK